VAAGGAGAGDAADGSAAVLLLLLGSSWRTATPSAGCAVIAASASSRAASVLQGSRHVYHSQVLQGIAALTEHGATMHMHRNYYSTRSTATNNLQCYTCILRAVLLSNTIICVPCRSDTVTPSTNLNVKKALGASQ
jgi:hypothetical protein